MKQIFSITFLIFTLSPAYSCVNIGVLSHFNSIGNDGTVYGRQILEGLDKAKQEIKGTCFNLNKIDIGKNLGELQKTFRLNKEKNDYFVGLGQSNKVSAIKSFLGDKMLFSPTATSNTFSGSKTIFLTSGINSLFSKKISKHLNNHYKDIGIIFSPSNIYSVDLKNQIQQNLKIKGQYYETSKKIKSKHDAIFIILDENESAKAINDIDQGKYSKIIIGADSWGPKSIYLNQVFKDLKYVKSVYRFNTFTKSSKFSSDLAFYSYHSLKLIKILEEDCTQKSFKCFKNKKNKIPAKTEENYLSWNIKKEVVYER